MKKKLLFITLYCIDLRNTLYKTISALEQYMNWLKNIFRKSHPIALN